MKVKILVFFLGIISVSFGQQTNFFESIQSKSFNPSTLSWYNSPAKKWEDALPVGNGRLGAMVFGRNGEERIQLNEETYW